TLTGGVVDADVAAGAAIAPSKVSGTAAILGANAFTGNQSITGDISASTATVAGTIIFPASGIQSLGAGAILSVDRAFVRVTGSGASQTRNATTPIAAGTAGQMVVIEGTNAFTVSIPAGGNVKFSGSPTAFALGPNDIIALLYDGTNWVELYRSLNVD
ncbi:MAG: hypothetical protein AAB359_03380, partial [Elusimicrobiota bacterium]